MDDDAMNLTHTTKGKHWRAFIAVSAQMARADLANKMNAAAVVAASVARKRNDEIVFCSTFEEGTQFGSRIGAPPLFLVYNEGLATFIDRPIKRAFFVGNWWLNPAVHRVLSDIETDLPQSAEWVKQARETLFKKWVFE